MHKFKKMQVHTATFLASYSNVKSCPDTEMPEYAFIGRSNVGKSSLINMLTGQNKLAKISSKPGKTQLLNQFLINDSWMLMDMPGYGWAKASKTDKAKWEIMNHEYLLERKNLCNLFVLIDSRLPPQRIDLEFLNWAGEKEIPLSIVFTKADKQSKNHTQSSVAAFHRELKKYWVFLPPAFITSSEDKRGKEELLGYIEEANGLFAQKND